MDLQHDSFSSPEKVGDASRIGSSRCQLRSCWEVPESTGSTRENCLSTGMLVGLVGPERTPDQEWLVRLGVISCLWTVDAVS